MSELKNRYDFVLFFDVQDGNPNGDPDAGNMPRVDNETGLGLVTDVCLKRKIRNFVQYTHAGDKGYDIYVRSKEISGLETFLNKEIQKTREEIGFPAKPSKTYKPAPGEDDKVVKAMCEKYYDIRTFGAVLTNGKNAGQVRGPVQLTFSRSISPIVILGNALTVCAARQDEKDYDSQVGIQGNKYTVHYGLYAVHGFISPLLAGKTGFSAEDLDLFFKALVNMFEYDRSAARGMMASRRLIVFKHDDALGNAPAWKLFDLVHAEKKTGVTAPRSYQDYDITVDSAKCPAGVTVEELI